MSFYISVLKLHHLPHLSNFSTGEEKRSGTSISLSNCAHYANIPQLFQVREALKLPFPAEMNLFLALLSSLLRRVENASITLCNNNNDDEGDSEFCGRR